MTLSDIRMPMDGPGFYGVLSRMQLSRNRGLAFIIGDVLSPRVQKSLNARPYLERSLTPRDIRELLDVLMRHQAG
jgi:hypothetical protein